SVLKDRATSRSCARSTPLRDNVSHAGEFFPSAIPAAERIRPWRTIPPADRSRGQPLRKAAPRKRCQACTSGSNRSILRTSEYPEASRDDRSRESIRDTSDTAQPTLREDQPREGHRQVKHARART